MIHHNKGHLLEEDQYYPYGLKMAGISDEALPVVPNNYLYNGKELNHEGFSDGTGLDWYDYGFRNYDPQLGRFTEQDPLTDNFATVTPYQYGLNDPVANIDEDGLSPMNLLCPLTSGFAIFLLRIGEASSQIASSPLTRALSYSVHVLSVADLVGNTLVMNDKINNLFMAPEVGGEANAETQQPGDQENSKNTSGNNNNRNNAGPYNCCLFLTTTSSRVKTNFNKSNLKAHLEGFITGSGWGDREVVSLKEIITKTTVVVNNDQTINKIIRTTNTFTVPISGLIEKPNQIREEIYTGITTGIWAKLELIMPKFLTKNILIGNNVSLSNRLSKLVQDALKYNEAVIQKGENAAEKATEEANLSSLENYYQTLINASKRTEIYENSNSP